MYIGLLAYYLYMDYRARKLNFTLASHMLLDNKKRYNAECDKLEYQMSGVCIVLAMIRRRVGHANSALEAEREPPATNKRGKWASVTNEGSGPSATQKELSDNDIRDVSSNY